MSQTDSKEVLGSGAGLAGAVAIESGTELGEIEVKARGYWEQVWRRFKRDKIAIAGGITIILLLSWRSSARRSRRTCSVTARTTSSTRRSTDRGQPIGPFSSVPDPLDPNKTRAPASSAPTARSAATSSCASSTARRSPSRWRSSRPSARSSIGTLLGSMAGYFRGWVDTVVSRVTEITMAFPALLFIIALASTVGDKLDNITFGGSSAPASSPSSLIFTLFGWFYPARIIRAVVLSLREKEFVEAARMVGSSDWRIIRSHILPHLVAPIIVYSTLSVAGFILGEAGLSLPRRRDQAPDARAGGTCSSRRPSTTRPSRG